MAVEVYSSSQATYILNGMARPDVPGVRVLAFINHWAYNYAEGGSSYPTLTSQITIGGSAIGDSDDECLGAWTNTYSGNYADANWYAKFNIKIYDITDREGTIAYYLAESNRDGYSRNVFTVVLTGVDSVLYAAGQYGSGGTFLNNLSDLPSGATAVHNALCGNGGSGYAPSWNASGSVVGDTVEEIGSYTGWYLDREYGDGEIDIEYYTGYSSTRWGVSFAALSALPSVGRKIPLWAMGGRP